MVDSTIRLDQFDTEPPDGHSHGGCSSCGSGAAKGGARCGNGLEKIYPTTAVRFGYMRYIGEFRHAEGLKFTCGAKVIIQTRRGIEIGEQVSLTCGGCDKSVTRDQMRDWVSTSGADTYMFDAGRILREGTAADLAEYARIQEDALAKRNLAQGIANRLNLSLKVVECECLFGGERILFFFTSAERVDFRVMVKELATEYRTRIEMRQVGARDEARLLADFETCGREVCCKVFLKTLKPISMRMAKIQKATLDPAQVSGRCGRLKCCLRYEHIGYEELDKKLPRVGTRIRTEHGEGVVVNRQILTQLVQIRTAADKMVTVVTEDILERNLENPPEVIAPAKTDRPDSERGAKDKDRQRRPAPRRAARTDSRPREQSESKPTAEGGDGKSSEDRPQKTPGSGRRRGRRRGPRDARGRRDGGPPPAGG